MRLRGDEGAEEIGEQREEEPAIRETGAQNELA